MDTTVNALKSLYTALGGDAADVADIATNPGMIAAIKEIATPSITAADNGKVVVNGELVAQTAMPEEITEDGEYDTTVYNSVTVSGGGGGGGYALEVAVDKAATLADVAMSDYESGLFGVMSFAINLGGSPVSVEFGIRFGKNGGTPMLTGGSWDMVGNQGAVALFSYDPASPGMTCEKLLMISGTTVTDLTSTAASIISVITIGLYVQAE